MKLTLSSSSRIVLAVALLATCWRETNGERARRSLSEEEAHKIKKDHHLKDDAQLEIDFISSSEKNPTVHVAGRVIELDALDEYSVAASDAKIIIDGKAVQNIPPANRMYTGRVDGASVFFVKNEQNDAKFLHVHDGSSQTSLHPIGNHEGEDEMVVIKSEDYDVEKINKMFRYGDSEAPTGDETGQTGQDGVDGGDDVEMDPTIDYDNMIDRPPRDSANSCSAIRKIEVAIVFDSSFCSRYGGGDGSGAIARINSIVGLASERFGQDGLCTSLTVSHYEGFCNPTTDVWRSIVSNNDDNALPEFAKWMNANRSGTRRDVAHLFTGTDFSGPTSTVIGRAYLETVCSSNWAYGIDWITFTSNIDFQALLFTHEIGHNAGAEHYGTSYTGFIMNPTLNGGWNGFSSQSVGSMNNYLNQQNCVVGGGTGSGGGSGSVKASRSQRRLQSTASHSFHPGDKTYQAYLTACGHFEYPLFLHVDTNSHLLVYGVPPDQAQAAGCPFGAAHSIFMTRHGKPVVEKEILLWSNVEEGLSVFMGEESLAIGTFKLADLAAAFEATPDEAASNRVYDLVTNNCATYMVKMASTLGVKIDSRITSFVARRLLEESGRELADKIRNSNHYLPFFGSLRHRNLRSSSQAANEPTDEELVEALVNKGASPIFAA